MTCALLWPERPCLHLDQGGDENSDDAFPLVVPTGFEPVSHLESVLGADLATCDDGRIWFLTCGFDAPAVLVIS
jgi:hypothetical protein